MSHHGREGEVEVCGDDCVRMNRKLTSAVYFIQRCAAGVCTRNDADAWLEDHGYECKASRKAARARRSEELDREIARLQAERARL